MAMTVRLPAELLARGRRYATELGISLNGLLALALREYLERRQPETRQGMSPQSLGQAIARRVQAGPVRRRR